MRILLVLCALSFESAGAACDFATWSKSICISDTAISIGDAPACEPLDSHKQAVDDLQYAFENAPEFFRDLLCKNPKLNVAPLVPAQKGTYSWAIFGKEIGINKTNIDLRVDLLNKYNTGLRFVSGQTPAALTPQMAQFTASSDSEVGAFLRSLLAHEIGHMLYNAPENEKAFGTCGFASFLPELCADFPDGSYGKIDWINGYKDLNKTYTVQKGVIAPDDADLRSYVLVGPAKSIDDVNPFLEKLMASSFVTTFSLMSPEEDFCETLSDYVLAHSMDSIILTFPSGTTVNTLERIRQPDLLLKTKIDFLETFLGVSQP